MEGSESYVSGSVILAQEQDIALQTGGLVHFSEDISSCRWRYIVSVCFSLKPRSFNWSTWCGAIKASWLLSCVSTGAAVICMDAPAQRQHT